MKREERVIRREKKAVMLTKEASALSRFLVPRNDKVQVNAL
jgi:hypothetical protein